MKKILFSSIILFFSTIISLSQIIDTFYFDAKYRLATANQFYYYRIAQIEEEFVKVTDYSKTGELRMTGCYRSIDFKEKIGPFYYYQKFTLSVIEIDQPTKYPEIYSKYTEVLDFIPDLPDSLKLLVNFSYRNRNMVNQIGFTRDCCTFYDFGSDKDCCFVYGQWFYILNKNDILCQPFRNRQINGIVKYYHKRKLVYSCNYVNGKREGEYKRYDKNGNLTKTDYYLNGKRIKKYVS